MIFIDANVFLAYENANDVHHKKAVKLLQEIESDKYGRCFISDYVFNEIVGVSLRKFGKERAINLGRDILRSTIVFNVDDHMLLESWKMFTNTELKLNLVDCSNVIATRTANAEFIATFDDEFKNVGGIKIISE